MNLDNVFDKKRKKEKQFFLLQSLHFSLALNITSPLSQQQFIEDLVLFIKRHHKHVGPTNK